MNHEWIKGNGVEKIISNEQLSVLMQAVTPVIYKDGKHFFIEPVDPRRVSYIWNPKITKEISFERLHKVSIDFPCGYYGFFKPSIAEVLAWFPHESNEGINCFCIETNHVDIYETGEYQRVDVVFGRYVEK